MLGMGGLNIVIFANAAVEATEVDSRLRGNDDAGEERPEYCHSRESGNPVRAFALVSQSRLQLQGAKRWLLCPMRNKLGLSIVLTLPCGVRATAHFVAN